MSKTNTKIIVMRTQINKLDLSHKSTREYTFGQLCNNFIDALYNDDYSNGKFVSIQATSDDLSIPTIKYGIVEFDKVKEQKVINNLGIYLSHSDFMNKYGKFFNK